MRDIDYKKLSIKASLSIISNVIQNIDILTEKEILKENSKSFRFIKTKSHQIHRYLLAKNLQPNEEVIQ